MMRVPGWSRPETGGRMAEQLIIGAGLSGLVASIILARKGYSVRLL